jgi:DNA-binding beta-propeller fold protein YncE
MKVYQNRFLMVTTYDINAMNVISLADEAVIKCFEFDAQPEEIVIDEINKLAYVSTPSTSSIYVIDLNKMQMKQKIQVNGRCTKLTLADKATKIIYVDKTTNDVWCVELDNDYTIKEVGIFPNVSAIAYSQNKIYLASRTKNRVAIVDYATMTLADEFEVSPKPVSLATFQNSF